MSAISKKRLANRFLDYEVLNLPIHDAAKNLDLKRIKSFCAADVFVGASKDASLKKIIQNSTIFCDSKPLKIYLKLKNGQQIQIRGSDYMRYILSGSNFRVEDHLFLGGTAGVQMGLTKLILSNQEKISSKQINFIIPPRNVDWKKDHLEWLAYIKNHKIKKVWIGLGNPKQFYVADLLKRETSDVDYYCVGAAFDFLSGVKKEAPKFLQYLSLEWLFRLFQEPKRLWKRYLVGNWFFLTLLCRDVFKLNHDE